MGLYFAWLGFYNQMLVIPSIVGIFIFIYGLATAYVDSFNVAGWVQSVATSAKPISSWFFLRQYFDWVRLNMLIFDALNNRGEHLEEAND